MESVKKLDVQIKKSADLTSFDAYLLQQEEAQKRIDLKMQPIAKQIMVLAYELNQLLPFAVDCHWAGHVNSIDIRIYEKTDYSSELWGVDLYTKGILADMKKAKAVLNALKKAVRMSCLPDEIPANAGSRMHVDDIEIPNL